MSAQDSEELRVLREILKWTRFAGFREVKAVLENILNTPEKKLAYQLSDGTRGTREVAQQSRVRGDIPNMWKEWRKQGLGDTVSVQRGERFRRSFDLEDFGIEVPQAVVPQMSVQPAASTSMPAVPTPTGDNPSA
jgi:hypothetical protein